MSSIASSRYSFAAQYLHQFKNLKLFSENKEILQYYGKTYDVDLKQIKKLTSISVENTAKTLQTPNERNLRMYDDIKRMGYKIVSIPIKKSGMNPWRKTQRVIYCLVRTDEHGGDYGQIPHNTKIVYDSANRRLRLQGSNCGPYNYGPWQRLDPHTRTTRRTVLLDPLNDPYSAQKELLKRIVPYNKKVIRKIQIKEMPVLITDHESIVCLPLERNEPDIGLVGQRSCFTGDTVVLDRKGYPNKISEIHNSWVTGVKKVYRVRFSNGRTVKCTLNHPFYTNNGFKELKNINVGSDKIALLNSFENGRETINVSADLAKLLGYLNTDGYLKSAIDSGQSIKFTNTNKRMLSEVRKLVKKTFPKLNIKEYNKGNGKDLLLTCRDCKNPLRDLIKSMDYDNNFPRDVFLWSEEKIGFFLNRAYSSDGCVHNRVQHSTIELTNGINETYSKYFQLLLLRIGIRANMKIQKRKNYRDQYNLVINNRPMIKKFFEKIGFIYGKEEQSKIAYDNSLIKKHKYYSYQEPNPFHPPKNDGEQMIWGTIKSITYLYEDEVYDMRVPNKHWFVADGIMVHNSGKSFMGHSICDHAFWKGKKKVAVMNDYQRECGTWCMPWDTTSEFAYSLQRIGEIPLPLPCVYIHPTTNTKKPIITNEGESGFQMSFPYKELIRNFINFAKGKKDWELGKSAKYFNQIQTSLLDCKTEEDVIRNIEIGIPDTQELVRDKLIAIIRDVFQKKITDLSTGVPSHWTVENTKTGIKRQYNPITACLVADLVPVLVTPDTYQKEHFPQLFKYYANDIFTRQVEDEHFIRNDFKIWMFVDEITSIDMKKSPTVASEILGKIVAEGRPRRIGFMYATQNPEKISDKVATNTTHLFAFRFTNSKQAKSIADNFDMAAYEKKNILGLKPREVIACTSQTFIEYNQQGRRKIISNEALKGLSVPSLSTHKPPSQADI